MSNSDRLIYECYFADGESEEDDGLIWKDVLREGEWAYRPGPNQKPINVPLRVVPGNSTSREEIGMRDLVEAFEDGAVEHVTIPTNHGDKPHENTGFTRKLKIVERDGKHILRAGIDFTEPDIKEKVSRGTIANSSAGIIFDYIQKQTGKKYKQVLGHIALTNKPWITGNQPFGVAASEHYSEDEIQTVVDEDQELERLKEDIKTFSNTQERLVQRAQTLGANQLIPDLNLPRFVIPEDGAESGAEKESHTNKEENMAERTESTEDTPVNPPSSAPEVTPDMLDQLKADLAEQFKADLEAKNAEIESLREKASKQDEEIRAARVEKRISELSGAGLSEYPGLLAEIRGLMLADSGEETLSLSEAPKEGADPVEVKLSVTDALERVITALPTNDGKITLGEQHSDLDDHSRPATEVVIDDSNLEARIDKFAEEVGFAPAIRSGE